MVTKAYGAWLPLQWYFAMVLTNIWEVGILSCGKTQIHGWGLRQLFIIQ